MLAVEDWAEIRRLHRAEGMPIKAIARRLGVSRNTVRGRWLSIGPPRYERPATGVDRGRGRAGDPGAAGGVSDNAGDGDRGAGRLVRVGECAQGPGPELRPLFAPPDPASRTSYQPGELAQCDLWFPPVDVPLGHGQVGRPPVLVMVSGYSRVIAAVMLPSRQAPDLICRALAAAAAARGGAASAGVGQRGRGRVMAGRPAEADRRSSRRSAALLGIRVIQCRPRDPEAKGLVERANGYLETSFLPGRIVHLPGRLQRPAGRRGWPVRTPAIIGGWAAARRTGWTPTGPRCCALPPVAAELGWRPRPAAAPRPLRAPGRQRLLGAPARDRPPGRGRRRPGHRDR